MASTTQVDLSNNVNFLGPPADFERFVKEASHFYKEYPDRYQLEPRKRFAEVYQISQNNVAFGIGATELLSVVPHLSKSCAVVISPGFWEYRFFYEKLHQAQICHDFILQANDNFNFDFDKLSKQLAKTNADVCYLANPNNPTTSTFSRNEFLNLALVHSKVLFVVDETYLPFSKERVNNTLIKAASENPNILVIGSFSKVYSLPGIRLGFGVASPKIVESLYSYLLPYGVATLSLKLVPFLLNQHAYLEKTQKIYQEVQNLIVQKLKQKFQSQLKIYRSDAPFVLIKVNPEVTNIASKLLHQGIIVRSGSEFSGLGPEYFRINLLPPEKIHLLIEALVATV